MTVDRETIDVYDAKAQEYDDIFFAGSAGKHLRRFMDALVTSGHVLDLGCGPGNAAALMQNEGFQLTCLDASAEMVGKAKARGLNARVATFDDVTHVDTFDGIWANFSLLHAPRADLPRHFAALSRAMKGDAVFHIGMKVGTEERRDALGRKYTFVTEDELRGLMHDVGITPTSVHPFHEVGMAGTNDPCIVIQGHKNA